MSAYRELRERAEAEAWLAGGLCLMRLARPDGGEHVRMAPWILGALSDAGALPPVGVIVDIGQLVLGRSLTDMASMQPLGPELQGVLGAYEDNVLGRLEADPRLDAVIDAVARLPEARRDAAIALFCVHLVQRLAADQMVAVSPGAVRRIVEMPAAELYAIGDAAVIGDSPVLPVLVSGYRALISGARRAGMLISEAAVFLMENFAALGELTQRLAIEQMIEAADALAGELPRRLKPRPERGEIPTPLAAEDNYPTGGFSSLSTSGSLENLVTSELVYMEDIRPDVIDLFELRYAEGELLYYTRDESVFVRGRRVITFALMPDLEAARCKDRELEWQRLVILFAVILSVIRRLAGWLEGEGLRFRLLFVNTAGSAAEPLAAESGLAALLLREWIDKQVVEIARAASLSQIYDEEGERARTARTELIVIATEEPEIQPIEGVLVGAISLADVEPRLIWAHRAAQPAPQADMSETQPGAAWRAWTAMTIELIQELL